MDLNRYNSLSTNLKHQVWDRIVIIRYRIRPQTPRSIVVPSTHPIIRVGVPGQELRGSDEGSAVLLVKHEVLQIPEEGESHRIGISGQVVASQGPVTDGRLIVANITPNLTHPAGAMFREWTPRWPLKKNISRGRPLDELSTQGRVVPSSEHHHGRPFEQLGGSWAGNSSWARLECDLPSDAEASEGRGEPPEP